MTPTKEQLADPAWWKANAPDWAAGIVTSSDSGALYFVAGFDIKSIRQSLDKQCPDTNYHVDMTIPNHAWIAYATRPKAWTGPQDGLPPVGTQFELLYSSIHGTYATVEAIAHRNDGVVICFLSTPDGVRDGEYQLEHHLTEVTAGYPHARLEETPKQKAARERAEVIDRIKEIICRDGAFDLLDPEVGAAAWALYNNGLRFTEKP